VLTMLMQFKVLFYHQYEEAEWNAVCTFVRVSIK